MKLRFLLPLFCTAASAFAQVPVTVDETARFLAGLPVEGPLAPLMQSPAWQQHTREMDEAWMKKQSQQILPIREWMWTNAEPHFRSTGTMYYMFAGPDILYANTFFPYASTYILAGLEPVGQVPDLTGMPPEQIAAELAALRGSMSTMLRFQYFITKDMRVDLGRGSIGGTLPILYVFIARLGYEVLDVAPMTAPAEGVKIRFQDRVRQQPQTVYYFKTDLSGGGNTPFLKWSAARGPGVSLLKAASYLMHTEGFNGVRNFLLQNSSVIVQDDTGIPLRAFPKKWSVNLYGRYVPHGEMFGKYHQPDLAAVFDRNPPGPLGFAFGYHWQPDRGILMLATPDGGGARSGEATPESSSVPRALPVESDVQPAVPRALPVEPQQKRVRPR